MSRTVLVALIVATTIAIGVLFVTNTTATPSAADRLGFIQRLPRDGTWASYDFEGKKGGKESGTVVLRMVGTTTENGRKCRWIEMQIAESSRGKTTKILMKILVRESDFAASAKKTPEILRGWKKHGDKAAAKMTDGEKSSLKTMLFQSYKLAKTIKLERVIDSKKGRLKIATATRAMRTMQVPQGKTRVKAEFIVTMWLHKKAPFGTARMETSVQTGKTTFFESKGTLQDYGTGAKSALPEKN